MAEEGRNAEHVLQLHERLDEQQWQQKQHELSCGPGFGTFYSSVCDRIRAENTLETVMGDFEKCKNDRARIAYVSQFAEVRELRLQPNTSGKCEQEAQSCEDLYDLLVPDEVNAARALEVVQRAVQKTPTNKTNALAIRYMKRAWALLLLEYFDEAQTDANRSLKLAASPGLLWNAHEILAHCHAKLKQYKASESHFLKALDGLRKSSVTNEEKAAVAGRVSTVFRMVKEENKPKNRAKTTAKKQEVTKKKRQGNKKQKEGESTNEAMDTEPPTEEKQEVKEDEAPKVIKKLELPKLSYGKNARLESASAALTVVQTGNRGRCVLANKDIKAGSVVMVDRPHVFAVSASQLSLRCNQCCARCLTSLPCQHCSVVQYCSEACQVEGAPHHRLECSVMTQLYDAALGNLAPLVFRILDKVTWTRLKKSKEKLSREHILEDEKTDEVESIVENNEHQKWHWDGHYSPQDYLTIFYLVSNSTKRSFGDHLKRSLSAVYITQCLKAAGFFGSSPTDEDQQYVATLALRHLQSCSCNAYEISEMQLEGHIADNRSLEVGGAIYPTISLTNHSCFPNVARYNIGNSCVLRATRLIPRGEEVLDNYGYYYHSMTVVERRDALRRQYKFECTCEACQEAWPLYPHRQGEPIMFKCPVPSCSSPSSFLDGRRLECAACGDQEQYRKLVTEIGSKLDNYSKALKLMHESKFEAALQILVAHQSFLEPHALYPAKHYTDVQEMMRHCLNCLGNTHTTRQAAAAGNRTD